jgi:hypothetical protein
MNNDTTTQSTTQSTTASIACPFEYVRKTLTELLTQKPEASILWYAEDVLEDIYRLSSPFDTMKVREREELVRLAQSVRLNCQFTE